MRTCVMVPTYNERESIGTLITALLALDAGVDVLVVDDRSPDGTGAVADEFAAQTTRVHAMHRLGPKGYSASSKDGLRWCLDHGYDGIVTMDADLSHDPAVIPALLAAVESGAALAIGSRYTTGGGLEVAWGPIRRAVSQAGSAYARLLIGTTVKDCTSGFRCYRSVELATVAFERIQSEGYSFLVELLGLYERKRYPIVEVPITYVDRIAGASKISRVIVLEALWRTTLLGLNRLRRR